MAGGRAPLPEPLRPGFSPDLLASPPSALAAAPPPLMIAPGNADPTHCGVREALPLAEPVPPQPLWGTDGVSPSRFPTRAEQPHPQPTEHCVSQYSYGTGAPPAPVPPGDRMHPTAPPIGKALPNVPLSRPPVHPSGWETPAAVASDSVAHCETTAALEPAAGTQTAGAERVGSELGHVNPTEVPTVTPVSYRPSRGQSATVANWKALPQNLIKDLMKALKENGRESSCFESMLYFSLAGITVVPHDLRQIFKAITGKVEFQLWEVTWEKLLQAILPGLLEDPTTATDNAGNPITLDHLLGQGDWKSASDQAAGIPKNVLELVAEQACKAFLKMQPCAPSQCYLEIFQEPKEPYVKVVERLAAATEQQFLGEEGQNQVIQQLAYSNANDECTAAINMIPREPGTIPLLKQICKL